MEVKLQSKLFSTIEENLILAAEVSKPSKSSQASRKGEKLILCLSTLVSASPEVHICVVKNVEKSDKFKMKKQWTLDQLKMVDAKAVDEDNSIVLSFHKSYRFVFDSHDAADAFLSMLWKFCSRILGMKPPFEGIPDRVISAVESKQDAIFSVANTGKEKSSDDAKQGNMLSLQSELSEKEEASLEKCMANYDDALGNVERFTQHLKECLEGLDGANIYSIITADEKLNDLMETVGAAEKQTTRLEQKIEQYISILSSVDDQLIRLQDRDTLAQVKQQNISQLIDLLDSVTNTYNIPPNVLLCLKQPELRTAAGIQKVTEAARELRRIKGLEIPPGLERMAFISDQQRRLHLYEVNLAQTVTHNVNNTILQQANNLLLSAQQANLSERLQSHKPAHSSLSVYIELVDWLSTVSPESTNSLGDTYVNMFSRVAVSEFTSLIDALCNNMTEAQIDRASMSSADYARKKSRSSASLVSNESHRETQRQAMMRAVNLLLDNIQTWYLSEKDFCKSIFRHGTGHKGESRISENLLHKTEVGNHLLNFLGRLDHLDSLNGVFVLVRLTDWTQSLQTKGDHALQKLAASTLLHAKRAFDANIGNIISSMEHFVVLKKKRVGLLPFAGQFETFAREAEAVFAIVGHRHADIDKAYGRLLNTVFAQLGRVANEQQKVMPAVVLMENFNSLHSVLSELHIPTLEAERKSAREHRQRELHVLVSNALESVMPVLMAFVDSANALIARGVKAEEVHFQAQFSRAEMHKLVTSSLNHKELPKQLGAVCERLRKNLTDDSNTLAIVFGRLQEVFLAQFTAVEELVRVSYPGLRIDVTQSDVQRYFSEISKSLY